MSRQAFVFGYAGQGSSLVAGLRSNQFKIHIIETSEDRCHRARADGFLDVIMMDILNDNELNSLDIDAEDHIVCVMEDEHLNVFLTLSLRSLFPDTNIVAISDSIYTTQKLKMAGASKVIDIYKISANRIHNILNKPVATKLLDSFLLNNGDISYREIHIPNDSFLDGLMVDEVDFSKYGILLVGLIDVELSHKFIFTTTSHIDHKLDTGDVMVCIGRNSDVDRFEKLIKPIKVEQEQVCIK